MADEVLLDGGKRWKAYVLSEISWKVILIAMMVYHRGLVPTEAWSLMMTITLITGFIESLVLGGLVASEHYIALAKTMKGDKDDPK